MTPHTFILCTCLIVTQILLHVTPLFLIHVPLIRGYDIPLNTDISYSCIIATWISCTQLLYVLTPLLHRLTGMYVLIVSVFLLHEPLFISHRLLLHGYSCIPLHDCSYINIFVTGHVSC